MTIVGTILSFILSLLFVLVAGRLAGTVGTSNLPVSGMTIATIKVITTVVFVSMGWTSQAGNKSTFIRFIHSCCYVIAGGYCQSQKVTFVVGGNKNEMLYNICYSWCYSCCCCYGFINWTILE